MWGVALPDEDQKRLRLGYQIAVESSRNHAHHSSPFIHQDGAPLYSKDRFRFTFFSKIQTYVYIVLLSSEGEVSVPWGKKSFEKTSLNLINNATKPYFVTI
jgi:hypothetical protein